MHLAAESHVDRSITDPGAFIRTNVIGTQVMLDGAARPLRGAAGGREGALPLPPRLDRRGLRLAAAGRVLHGGQPLRSALALLRLEGGLGPSGARLARDLRPAGAGDELLEQLRAAPLPREAHPADDPQRARGQQLPVYGDGLNERDWIHVEDHARGLVAVLERGRIGETYLLGGRAVRNNLAVVKALCAAFDRLRPERAPHETLIRFVADRPGHDRRYAIDPGKAEAEVGWAPSKTFEQALEETVRWYLDNEAWWRPIREGRYGGERLGLGASAEGRLNGHPRSRRRRPGRHRAAGLRLAGRRHGPRARPRRPRRHRRGGGRARVRGAALRGRDQHGRLHRGRQGRVRAGRGVAPQRAGARDPGRRDGAPADPAGARLDRLRLRRRAPPAPTARRPDRAAQRLRREQGRGRAGGAHRQPAPRDPAHRLGGEPAPGQLRQDDAAARGRARPAHRGRRPARLPDLRRRPRRRRWRASPCAWRTTRTRRPAPSTA